MNKLKNQKTNPLDKVAEDIQKGSKITKESIDSFTASCFIQEDAT